MCHKISLLLLCILIHRCDRVSTDNSSDSGSSGIVSDMDSASNTEILLSLLTPPPLADSPLLCTTPKLIK